MRCRSSSPQGARREECVKCWCSHGEYGQSCIKLGLARASAGMTAYGTTQTAIEAMKLGAYDYLLKPFDVPKLKEIVFNALKAASDMRQVVSYQPLLEKEDYELGIVGRSEPMQQVFKLIGQLAASDATALISGESGTGKELVARAIYHHSHRSQQAFLAVNCAAIPEQLLESELFGHERGAFTGAIH